MVFFLLLYDLNDINYSNMGEWYFFLIIKKNKLRKVLKKDGLREILEIENIVVFDFLGWFGVFFIKFIVDENIKDFMVRSY